MSLKFIGFTALLLVGLSVSPSSGQKPAAPEIKRRIPPEKTANACIEAAIRKYLDVDRADAASLRYSWDRVDLNGDGKPEFLVYVTGPAFCGSGGCTALVLKHDDSACAPVAQITLARVPIVVSDGKSHGWRNLILPVSGGGAEPGYAVLPFDGAHYPDNPTVAPAHSLARKIAGDAYLVGAENKGLPLQPSNK